MPFPPLNRSSTWRSTNLTQSSCSVSLVNKGTFSFGVVPFDLPVDVPLTESVRVEMLTLLHVSVNSFGSRTSKM